MWWILPTIMLVYMFMSGFFLKHLITSLGNQILKHFCLPKAGLSFIINMEDCWEEISCTIVKHKNKLFKRTTKTKNQICLNCWAFHSQDYKQGGKTEEPTELSKQLASQEINL